MFAIIQLRKNPEYPQLQTWYTIYEIDELPEEIDFETFDVAPEEIEGYLESHFCDAECLHIYKIKKDGSTIFDTRYSPGTYEEFEGV